ncbi:MAG: class I SAM-dependent methyltransferase, partial [Thermodesulfovibrionales bacterium]|nr:class I SAM-dependent methyltransferase [Thermodesulfovibrionales bacterium]
MIKVQISNFWDVKSKKYPLPYEDSIYNKTIEIIQKVVNQGVVVENAYILDIGCGTGVFTLPLAERSSHVIGLDNSKSMIRILKEQADKKNIKNVTVELKSWEEVDALKWRKKFDIVWASMTPAIKSEKDLLKMEECSKKWCVYIGWGYKRENTFLDKAFKIFDGKYKSPAGGIKVNKLLLEMTRNPFVMDFTDSWSWNGTVEEAIEDVIINLQM